MRPRAVLGAALAGVVLAVVIGTAFANGNVVPVSHAGRQISALAVDDKKPKPACNGITVTNLVLNTSGGNSNDLVLGDSTNQSLGGGKGDDCILGGGGDDSLSGDQGNDVCIGGPGNDSFHVSCEVQIQ